MDIREFTHFRFTLLFTDVKALTGALTPFFYDKHRLEAFSIASYHEDDLGNWFDPRSGGSHLPSFFIGDLAVSDKSPVTLFVSNLADGWTTGARLLAKTARCRSIQVGMSQHTSSPLFKYEVVEAGLTIRIVQLYREGKWFFVQQGDPLPYEDVQRYRSKTKADRLTNEVIGTYLHCEGIDIESLFQQSYQGILYKQLAWSFKGE